jgi:acetolactate synthase-1/2/3 large subunit
VSELRQAEDVAAASDAELLGAEAEPVRPSRIYGELRQRLARDAVVICDGGDFASYAGKFIEVYQPGCWLDTGPYGCLGNGLGYAIAARVARPSSQVVLLLGDGAAGFSLMDVDTLVRHGLPVVMIVGNNGIWGLEKHPMQLIYGYSVAVDLRPETRYDQVVEALGGHGELVRSPALVNVLTDPAIAYPRRSNLT